MLSDSHLEDALVMNKQKLNQMQHNMSGWNAHHYGSLTKLISTLCCCDLIIFPHAHAYTVASIMRLVLCIMYYETR